MVFFLTQTLERIWGQSKVELLMVDVQILVPDASNSFNSSFFQLFWKYCLYTPKIFILAYNFV